MTFSVWAEAAQVCIATDVAYRVSSTGGRKFIVADAAGDEQYTRDMVIVASAADAAVLMVDLRKELPARRCHAWLTGRWGAGKSTIVNLVTAKRHALGRHTWLLDGDRVRRGLNKVLGFTDAGLPARARAEAVLPPPRRRLSCCGSSCRRRGR